MKHWIIYQTSTFFPAGSNKEKNILDDTHIEGSTRWWYLSQPRLFSHALRASCSRVLPGHRLDFVTVRNELVGFNPRDLGVFVLVHNLTYCGLLLCKRIMLFLLLMFLRHFFLMEHWKDLVCFSMMMRERCSFVITPSCFPSFN